MKKAIFAILLLSTLSAAAQTFDDAISRFVVDSGFTIQVDSAAHNYIDIAPFTGLKTAYTRLYFSVYSDYGDQPYTVSPGVVGITKYANVYFTFSGAGISEQRTIGLTNLNSNAYDGAHAFLSTKFLYWYFCDKNGITIQ